jgi:23S rRNA (adenine2503-C2)-methyltransferase
MQQRKINLLGLTRAELSEFATGIGEPAYRGAQLFQWLYEKGVADFRLMNNMSRATRDRLDGEAMAESVKCAGSRRSALEGTTKFLFELADGKRIETVLIPPSSSYRSGSSGATEDQRLTLCVSTQVGCPLDCKFCATATMGFHRNLTAGEILDQLLQVRREIGRKITNVVFMGMGEPLLNYDQVMTAAEIMTEGVGIAARRMTISTAGWADRIRQMGDELRKVKLAVSLHSAVDETRTRIMPVNTRFPVSDIGLAVEHYYRKTRRRVTFEQVFFDGINDSDDEISRLIRFVRRVPSKINVIPFHPIASAGPSGFSAQLRPSQRTDELVERLRSHRLPVFVRSNAGVDIDAACGQLAVSHQRNRQEAVLPGAMP